MTKVLLKKQIMESFSWLYQDKKTGKNRSKSGLVLYSILYLFVFGALGSLFFMMAISLCEPLVEIGMGWLYFAMMSLVAVFMGVFGSAFNTSAALYQAKDNDLLLSLPIPTGSILAMRLAGVYLMGLLYELIAMVPTLIVWFLVRDVSPMGIVLSLLITLVLSVFVLTLSCILGWVVAWIGSKIRNKSFVTVILSLAFFAAYYYVYFNAYTMLMSILNHADEIAGSVQVFLYPFYQMGLAAQGNVLSSIVFTGIVAVCFIAVYYVLSKSFLKIATANTGTGRVKYRARTVKAGNADSALLRKEFKRFTGSAVYMMNCGLGTIFLVIAGAALLIKGDLVMEMVTEALGLPQDLTALLVAAAACMMTTMNIITAPSVSLEGKNLWLVQVLPVSGWQVLKAKLKLHLILTWIPTALLLLCVEIVFGFRALDAVLICVVSALFVALMAAAGLAVNLKMPNLTWTSEAVPVKQSMSTMLVLFGGWAVVIVLGALYIPLYSLITPEWYLAMITALLLAACALLLWWLKKRGAAVLEGL
ncbi:MAG: hypothetical protein ACI4PO_02600 [Faecousia sp.]